jgi:outer membrane protein TolC
MNSPIGLLRITQLAAPKLRAKAGHTALITLLALSTAHAQQTNTNTTSPIDLPTVLRLVNARNLDVLLARSRLTEARANHDSAVEKFFPWVTPGFGYKRHDGRIQDVGGQIFDADKQSYTAGGVFAAQLDLGDAIYQSLAAKQQEHAADYALESQRQESTLVAALGYHELANARALVEVVREALNLSADYQGQLREAVGAGIAFKGDELRVQVQTERYQVALRQAMERQRLVAARLAETLHLDATVELVPESTEIVPLSLVETNSPLDSLVKQALKSRPELKENQAVIAAARDSKNGARYGPLIPSVGAQAFLGGLGGGKEGDTGHFASSEDYAITLGWRIGPGGLFDAGRSRSTAAQWETAKLAGARLEDVITRQVVEGHTRVHSLLDQLGTARQTLQTASETLRLTSERKQFGVGAVLEDIQAQQELTRARADFLNAVTDYNKAQWNLNRAVGSVTAEKP